MMYSRQWAPTPDDLTGESCVELNAFFCGCRLDLSPPRAYTWPQPASMAGLFFSGA